MAASSTGLLPNSDPAQFVQHIERLTKEVLELQQQVIRLTTKEATKKDGYGEHGL